MAGLTKKNRDMIKEYYRLKKQRDHLDKQIELLRSQIDDYVDFGTYRFDGLQVEIAERERMIEDKQAIKKYLGKAYSKFKKKSKFLVISVKDI